MKEVSLEMIIPAVIVACLVFVVGIFIGRRTGSDKKRVKELETELNDARKELEVYRTRVNSHFLKTSELFGKMTDSYKEVYLHLAEGSQDLCTSDAALLMTSNSEFLKVTHEDADQQPEVEPHEQQEVTGEPAQEQVEQPDVKSDVAPGEAVEEETVEGEQKAAQEELTEDGRQEEEQVTEKSGERLP